MATLIVEDGTRPSNANSYVSLAYADTYAETYGYLDWAGYSADERSAALIQASMAVDTMYGDRFMSYMYPDITQTFLWPRAYTWDADGRIMDDGTIPTGLKRAVVEMAIMYTNGVDIFPSVSQDVGLKSHSVSVGDISESKTWGSSGSMGASFPGFNKIEMLLRPLFKPCGTQPWRLIP